jgi:glutathionylspermidine synthase
MAGVTSPWIPVEPLNDRDFLAMRRRAIFDCDKWDPQVGDECVIARYPLVLGREAWDEVVLMAEALAREARAAETELAGRPDLHGRLGLPGAVRRALARGRARATTGIARIIRFDFHYTPDGWRISEANADVPGGLNEASGFPAIMAPHYEWAHPVGDPAGIYAEALLQQLRPGATIALVHATAYSDDRQMMQFIARGLAARGAHAIFAGPAHLRWREGAAHVHTQGGPVPVDGIVRFFPGEWLTQLPRASEGHHFFCGSTTPVSNPATALLVQTKRFPLVWDELTTPLSAWRALLPETRDPRQTPWQNDPRWVVKPALGRVGEGVGLREYLAGKDWSKIRRSARFWPANWIAQRRFEIVPVEIGGVRAYPCLGVYTIDERVAGAYGRLGSRPLIDSRAVDAAVLTAAASSQRAIA